MERENAQLDADFARVEAQAAGSADSLQANLPLPASAFVASINGQQGAVLLQGGSTGYSFSSGGAGVIILTVNAATVRSSISAAKSGDNSDITKLLGLTGGLRFIGRTSSAADPTATELPTDKDLALHENTGSGAIFLAFNKGGSILKVQLT